MARGMVGCEKWHTLHSYKSMVYFFFYRNRHWKIVIARLRLGHTRLTHSFLMEKKNSLQCSIFVIHNYAVEHVMAEGSKYSAMYNLWLNQLHQNYASLTFNV